MIHYIPYSVNRIFYLFLFCWFSNILFPIDGVYLAQKLFEHTAPPGHLRRIHCYDPQNH